MHCISWHSTNHMVIPGIITDRTIAYTIGLFKMIVLIQLLTLILVTFFCSKNKTVVKKKKKKKQSTF
jgi:hypothetical protein